jgi:Reverse transcriptase (RNA-dependent DNA polymerase)
MLETRISKQPPNKKVYIVAGPEFRTLEGHTLIIFKALYGLRSSGHCWYQRFADVLRAIGFYPTKAESEIWMRENDGLYEFIAVYVDDLLIAAKDPALITKTLSEQHKLKLKGVGPLSYHLGCDYTSRTMMEPCVMDQQSTSPRSSDSTRTCLASSRVSTRHH